MRDHAVCVRIMNIAELEKAAEQGFAEAQYELGGMYYIGEGGVPEDDEEALKWFRKAAEQGHAEAQYKVGFSYHLEFGGS
jgi:TPR repeat protein